MDPITLALVGGGLLGGFLGGKGKQPIDPKTLALLFGPDALAKDAQTLYGTLLNSPQFALMQSMASAQGTNLGNVTRANFARAGLGGSGVGALGSAVSRGFAGNLMLGARGNLWTNALNAAQSSLMARMGLWGNSQLAYQNQPTMLQSFGNALTGGAATGLAAKMSARAPGTTDTQPTPTTTTTYVTTAPMRRIDTAPMSTPTAVPQSKYNLW